MSMTHGPIVVRRRLGAVLKNLRAQLGLHLDVVARQLEISPSKLSRLETGQVAPRIRDVRDLLEIYEAPAEVRVRALAWADQAKEPGWWQPYSNRILYDLDLYISLEAEAQTVKAFCLPIAGLLQTPSYARMVLTGAIPQCSEGELDRLVEIRIRRQNVLAADRSDAPPLNLHVVLDESALHRGAPADLINEQLAELERRSHAPNITVQVLPFDRGYGMACSTFAIFEPRETIDWTVINVESAGQDTYLDAAGEVAKYREIWADLVSRAMDPDETRAFVARLNG